MARRLLYLLASFALAWALVAASTGGVGWVLGPLRLSSRQPVRPLLVGLAAAAWYLWRYTRDERREDGVWVQRLLRRAIPWAVVLMGCVGFALGVYYGSFAAAGSDSYGYVSQAHLWRTGSLRVVQPIVQQVSWPDREWVFAPLGYRPVAADGTIVPTYPPGLPILMAGLLGVLGEAGSFYAVPVFAALAVWCTYLLGRDATGSPVAAALASLFLLASPAFLAHVMVPMSDVPAAALWALVALLALRGNGQSRPMLAGCVAGLALLVRPNLILLALAPAVVWRYRREPLMCYALGLAPALLGLAAVNVWLYGSPLTFGYGTPLESYALSSAPANLRHYGWWLVQTQTPLIVLALIPLVVTEGLRASTREVSPRGCLSALLGLTLLSYVFYGEFTHWTYLRFLLPAFPVIFVLLAASLRLICLKLPEGARMPVVLCFCAAMIPHGLKVGADAGIFRQAAYERRHVRAALDVAARTPPTAAVLAVQHSGSVRYYANRITLRYDWLAADHLDAAVRDLTALGRRPFLVVDDWEEPEFRTRFAPYSRIGRLDWAPLIKVPGHPEVRIYDLGGRGE